MWKNAPFLEARFNKGYSEALTEAIKGVDSMNSKMANWRKSLSTFARQGDITAIIYGGYPLVKHNLAQGKSMEEAIEIFQKATIKAQQSYAATGRSPFQNSSNPISRLFLAFKNTANQYLRKMADATIQYQNGDISQAQWAKSMTIYGILNPLLYVLVGKLVWEGWKKGVQLITGEEPEDKENTLFAELLSQIALNPFLAIPIFDDILEFGLRKATGRKTYKIFSTPLIDDLETGLKKMDKKNITLLDVIESLGVLVEAGTGAPVKTGIRFIKPFMKEKKKSTGYK
jgi:hypothetical protein